MVDFQGCVLLPTMYSLCPLPRRVHGYNKIEADIFVFFANTWYWPLPMVWCVCMERDRFVLFLLCSLKFDHVEILYVQIFIIGVTVIVCL